MSRLFLRALAIALIVAACGGGAASAPAQTSGTGATNSAPTDVPAETEAGGVETQPPGGGGSGAADACTLLSAQDASAATGQANVVAQATAAGNFEGLSQCAYISNGVLPVVIVTRLGPDTNMDPATYHALPGTVDVAVNGAKAVFVPASGGLLFIFKNNAAVAVLVGAAPPGEDQLTVAKKLVQGIADRLG